MPQQSTDEAIASAFGFQKSETVAPGAAPKPRPKTIAEAIYEHLIPNTQKGSQRK
jgi:hypothetical protein